MTSWFRGEEINPDDDWGEDGPPPECPPGVSPKDLQFLESELGDHAGEIYYGLMDPFDIEYNVP